MPFIEAGSLSTEDNGISPMNYLHKSIAQQYNLSTVFMLEKMKKAPLK